VLLGSKSIDDYVYHPGPSRDADANGHHVIFAQNAEDVTLCGPGTIDGQGEAYWEPRLNRQPVLPEDAWKEGATGRYQLKDHNNRPSPMLEFAQCRNVRISGVTLKNSAGWTLRPIACETVVIDGVRIRNPNYGVNTDGMDITASRNVFVSNCDIATGDDAICLKSENPYGDLLPTKNITITNCVITTSCNSFKLGTASHGAFENIVFSNSVLYADADHRRRGCVQHSHAECACADFCQAWQPETEGRHVSAQRSHRGRRCGGCDCLQFHYRRARTSSIRHHGK
jgi:polygalacturonase